MIRDHFWSRIGHAYPDDQFHTTFGQDLVMKRDQLWSKSGHGYYDDHFLTNIGRTLVMIYDQFWPNIGHHIALGGANCISEGFFFSRNWGARHTQYSRKT